MSCARLLPAYLRALHLPRPRENQEPLEVVRQILQPDLGPGSQKANRANQFATHCRDLMAEDMFDPGSNPRPPLIARVLLSRERLVPGSLVVNLGAQSLGLELRFDLL